MKRFAKYLTYIAWVVALIGAILSFYFAELSQREPCRLCWYQRASLFPLVILLGMAIYRGDRSIVAYALPFSFIGAFVAFYQVLAPYLPLNHQCGRVECLDPVFSLFGFFSFPLLSALGFSMIFLLLL